MRWRVGKIGIMFTRVDHVQRCYNTVANVRNWDRLFTGAHMEEIEQDYIDAAPVFRLAAAVVKGLAADDPELLHWRQWGQDLHHRLNAQPPIRGRAGGLPPGHMHAEYADRERAANAGRRRRT